MKIASGIALNENYVMEILKYGEYAPVVHELAMENL